MIIINKQSRLNILGFFCNAIFVRAVVSLEEFGWESDICTVD